MLGFFDGRKGVLLRHALLFFCREEDFSVLCRPGGDLLSQVLRHSTIGAGAFDGRVRDGIGSGRSARATRPAKNGEAKLGLYIYLWGAIRMAPCLVCSELALSFRLSLLLER